MIHRIGNMYVVLDSIGNLILGLELENDNFKTIIKYCDQKEWEEGHPRINLQIIQS